MRFVAAVLVALLLVSCAATPPEVRRVQETGERVDPPAGFVEYCKRTPRPVECAP